MRDNVNQISGFTLIELLAVFSIIGLLVSAVVGAASYADMASKRARARNDMHIIADALDRYFLEFGNYPDVESSTNLLTWTAPVLNTETDYKFANLLPRDFSSIDPWSHAYRYKVISAPDMELDFYTLASDGPDKKEQTDDDILYP